jgi:hypothetical protein
MKGRKKFQNIFSLKATTRLHEMCKRSISPSTTSYPSIPSIFSPPQDKKSKIDTVSYAMRGENSPYQGKSHVETK